jgi:hypothetical protein
MMNLDFLYSDRWAKRPSRQGYLNHRHHGLRFKRNLGLQHVLRSAAQRLNESIARALLRIDAGQIHQPPYPPLAGLLYHRSVFHRSPHKWNVQIFADFARQLVYDFAMSGHLRLQMFFLIDAMPAALSQ